MRKYNALAIIISGVFAVSGSAFAQEQSSNKELSQTRTDISLQIMKNKLHEAELEGLRKQKEIQEIKDSLDGGSDVLNTQKSQVTNEVDYSVPWDEKLNSEDILTENNNWEQEVGFIYKDNENFSIGGSSSNPSSALIAEDSSDDLSKILEDSLDSIKEAEAEAAKEAETTTQIAENAFKVTGITLNKLSLFDGVKEAQVKVSYLMDNGFQKISGNSISNVVEGDKFNVKNEAYFVVKEITENGVILENQKTKKEVVVHR
jgi:hypothetical protein